MLVITDRRSLYFMIVTLIIVTVGLTVASFRLVSALSEEFNYRVFVAGIGTVDGKWCGDTGIAIIGLETRPSPEKGKELKVIDLLIANNSSIEKKFDSDIYLLNPAGNRYGIKAKGQPEVIIGPGALSQGTVIISVPRGIPDNKWFMEVKGGGLGGEVILPLKVMKVMDTK